MKPLPVATLLWLARDMNDLALARWQRAVERDAEAMTRVVMRADRDELREEWFLSHEAIEALFKWRDARTQDEEAKRADAAAAAELRIDKPAGDPPTFLK